MTDLEITKRCAAKMGYAEHDDSGELFIDGIPPPGLCVFDKSVPPARQIFYYDPLHDDAQAMALVKKFDLEIDAPVENIRVVTAWDGKKCISEAASTDLNRAICGCVAQLPD